MEIGGQVLGLVAAGWGVFVGVGGVRAEVYSGAGGKGKGRAREGEGDGEHRGCVNECMN